MRVIVVNAIIKLYSGHSATTMLATNAEVQEVVTQLAELAARLVELLLVDDDTEAESWNTQSDTSSAEDCTAAGSATREVSGALRVESQEGGEKKQSDDLTGQLAKITLRADKERYGKLVVVMGPRGDKSSPMYWWLKAVDDGEQFYKARTSFKLIEKTFDHS